MMHKILLLFVTFVSVKCSPVVLRSPDTGAYNNSLMAQTTLYQFEDSSYYLGTILKGTYFQAIMFCNYHNMDLVSIESAAENQFLFDVLNNFYGKGEHTLWTSGNALMNNEREFYWLSTGQKLVFTSWREHEPDNYQDNEKCLHAVYDKGLYKTLVWNDIICTSEMNVICETTVSKGQCPNFH